MGANTLHLKGGEALTAPIQTARFVCKAERVRELTDALTHMTRQSPFQVVKITAECHLQEPEVAEQLLGNDLYELCQNQTVQPKLLAQLKEDARLVRQLFQSAYVGDLQEELLEACDWFGESMLKEHLQSLLAQNPHFKEFE